MQGDGINGIGHDIGGRFTIGPMHILVTPADHCWQNQDKRYKNKRLYVPEDYCGFYIDTPDGVSFDELSSAQAWINDLMDELDPFPGAYTLEVSSPGIDRPLRTAEHFARFVGDTAGLKTQPVDGRGSWTGAIASVEGDVVVLDVDGAEARIPMDTIKRAHLKGTIDFGSQTSI